MADVKMNKPPQRGLSQGVERDAAAGWPVRLSPLMFFVVLCVTGLGIAYLLPPKGVAKICGPSTYWAALVSCILVAPLVFIADALRKRFPDHNILAAAKETFGNIPGAAFNLLYLSLLIGQAMVIIRDTAELASTYLLDTTPNWAVTALLLLCAGYMARYGLAGISRLAGFVFVPTLLFRIVLQLLAFQGLKASHLLPLFGARPLAYLNGGFSLTTSFGPMLVGLLFIYPLLAKPPQLKGLTLSLIGFQTVILFLTVLIVIGVFGAVNVQSYIWPVFEADRRIDIPLLAFNQVGLLFLIVWLTMFLIGFAFYLYLFASSLHLQFPRVQYLWLLVGVTAVIQAGATLIPNLFVDLWILRLIRQNALYMIYGYPVLILLTALLRGKGDKRHAV